MRITIVLLLALIIGGFYAEKIWPLYEKNEVASIELAHKIDALSKPPEPYTYQIPLYFSFNGSSPFLNASETDFAFLLTITYPNGSSLVPNDVVNITATAQIDKVIETLDYVGIIFPNTLLYPETYGDNHFPLQGILQLSNPVYYNGGSGVSFHNVFSSSDITIKWVTEGDYTPLVGFFFKDGTSKVYPTTNFVIHVYPMSEREQIENNIVSLRNNQANLELSKAVYLLSAVALAIAYLALVIEIIFYDGATKKTSKHNIQYRRRQIPVNSWLKVEKNRLHQAIKRKRSNHSTAE